MFLLTIKNDVISLKPRACVTPYIVYLQCPEQAVGGIYSCLNKRRGQVFDNQQIGNTPQFIVKSYLPVNESFGKNHKS